ncbi:SCO1431 family membrane protein [Streptomyces lunaelactis]|uniref:SCO1431 family membrane protein n=1 Tax=Streptomyces lunaelactis TaxID=1535768 RepID=UPI001584DABD|nr:SCO1431 family membrane protein [Streptomyces lunaelactis]NUK01493.1 SCO1431 family membrane protein [Streptomyces lunaelactis]NUK14533.1 SCO1431 family membrane protein [Streptomyces lunaelactis]NUK27438.1 SCO1431 family membrane protein [Streptomyces lunaelactis]NUK56390.1 SCO1431 family membrane protein [Streptomyces lunaelactis]NUK69897.1 SCO1431 family membrane protein [Streptomyces lunaelactis]
MCTGPHIRHLPSARLWRPSASTEDGPTVLEHILGWTLVVVLAMLVTQLGMI